MRNAPLAAALSIVLLAATAAHADVTVDADGTATVTLKNGSLYRGALVERIQGDHVSLKMATGEVKVFPWAELATAEGSAPPPPLPPPKPIEAPGVLVTLTGDEGVRLERVTSTETGGGWGGGWGGGGWGVGWGGRGRGSMAVIYGGVCQAPCNARVDSSYIYRVAGPGYVATRTFQISGDAVRIDAHMGSMAQRVLGWVVFGAGLAAGTTGLVGGWICASVSNCNATGWFIAGGVGLAATVAGLVMVLTSGSSLELDGQPVALRLAPHVALTPRGLSF